MKKLKWKEAYKIDKNTLKIIEKIPYEEFKEFDPKDKTGIGMVIRSFKGKYTKRIQAKTYRKYFYCRAEDYDLEEIKKFLHDRRYDNYIPDKHKNTIVLYRNNQEVKRFKSEIKAAEFLEITKQRLNYHLFHHGYFEKNGYRAIKIETIPFALSKKKKGA